MLVLGLALSIAALAAALLAGLGTRVELWDFRTGFRVLRWAAGAGLVGVGIAVVAGIASLRNRSNLVIAVVAILIGGAVAYIPWSWKRLGQRVPPIHDITTDTDDPPAFDAILPLRADAPNPAEYGGPEIAEQQRVAYPDVRPLRLDADPGATFERALEAARGLGWEIVAAEPDRGRIEAVATTRLFGFKDDDVVRIRDLEGGSVVDVRSVSRVGVSDIGTNARRIRKYLGRLSDG